MARIKNFLLFIAFIWFLFICGLAIWIFTPTTAESQPRPGWLVSDDAGVTYDFAVKAIFPTNSVTVSSAVATITMLASEVTVTVNDSTNENNLIPFVADAATTTGSHGLEMDTDFHYNPSTGTVTATTVATSGADTGVITCSNNGTAGVDAAGEFCYDSGQAEGARWKFFDTTKKTMADTSSTQTLTDKTFLWTQWIPAGSGPDKGDNAEVQGSPYVLDPNTVDDGDTVPYIAFDTPEELLTVRFEDGGTDNVERGYVFLIPDGWMGDGTDEENFKIRWVGFNSQATAMASGEIVELEIKARFLESPYNIIVGQEVSRGTEVECQYTAPANLETGDFIVTGWCSLTGGTDGTWDDEKILELQVVGMNLMILMSNIST